jgi:transcriptional regulator with XRE-family HTH domain
MAMWQTEIGRVVRASRKRKGWNQARLAEAATTLRGLDTRISTDTIHRIERGSNTTTDTLSVVFEALGIGLATDEVHGDVAAAASSGQASAVTPPKTDAGDPTREAEPLRHLASLSSAHWQIIHRIASLHDSDLPGLLEHLDERVHRCRQQAREPIGRTNGGG